MEIKKIIDYVNRGYIASDYLRAPDIYYFMDMVIDDINERLQAKFPNFTDWVQFCAEWNSFVGVQDEVPHYKYTETDVELATDTYLYDIELSDETKNKLDIDGDGVVDLTDAQNIAKIIRGEYEGKIPTPLPSYPTIKPGHPHQRPRPHDQHIHPHPIPEYPHLPIQLVQHRPHGLKKRVNTVYDAFPDEYIRTVVALGVAAKFYTRDEEGEQIALDYQNRYEMALFKMVRDYHNQVPWYFQDNTGGFIDFSYIREEAPLDLNPRGVVIHGFNSRNL